MSGFQPYVCALTAQCLSRASEEGESLLRVMAPGHPGGQGMQCPLVAHTATHLALIAASGWSGDTAGFPLAGTLCEAV